MKLKIILKPILFRVAAVALGFVVAAVVGEVAIRLTTPSRLSRSDHEHTFFCRFDRQLGWAPLENITAHAARGKTSSVQSSAGPANCCWSDARGVSYREPYPAFLKAAIAGGHLFNKNARHFSAAGHALFAKFLTDTEVALAAVDYYKQPH